MRTPNGDRILVVDDDALSRRLLHHALDKAGYDCREASDGTAALEMVQAQPPALLLLDFDMPGLNGADVLRQLRADNNPAVAQIPTIMLTGHGGEASEVLCLEAGADDFVTKPINLAVLGARIETQLRLRTMRRQLQQQNDELEAWRRNLERDLEAARLTQQSLIPQKPPLLPGWDIAACYRPVIQVGGDIYGWLRMADSRTLFWIADATGHGASAALMTTLAKLLFHHGTVEHNQPSEIMAAVNKDFRSIFAARSFMTAMCLALDPSSGRVCVVGAGHPPLLVARHDGRSERILSSAPPLGLAEKPQFSETALDLTAGDTLLLYTDGLCGNDDGVRRLTVERLVEILPFDSNSAETFLARLLEEAAPNTNNKPSADDIAAVAVRRTE
jgi:sigma-B regulation protein RsbU (phosphoserine phosphatase)